MDEFWRPARSEEKVMSCYKEMLDKRAVYCSIQLKTILYYFNFYILKFNFIILFRNIDFYLHIQTDDYHGKTIKKYYFENKHRDKFEAVKSHEDINE